MAAVKEFFIEYMEKRERVARETFNAYDLARVQIALNGEPDENTLAVLAMQNAWDFEDIRSDYLLPNGEWNVARAQDGFAEEAFDEMQELAEEAAGIGAEVIA